MAAGLPVLLWGALISLQSMRNTPLLWLPSHFAARRQFEAFLAAFQTADVIIVSWDGCTVEDPRLERLAAELTAPERRSYRRTQTYVADQVIDGRSVLRQLMEEPLDLSRNRAVRRLQGSLIGPDGQTSCVVIPLVWRRGDRRPATLQYVVDCARASIGLTADRLRLAGSLVEGLAIDAESERSFRRYAVPSALVCLALCRLCLGSWRLTLAVMAVATFGGVVVLAAAAWWGITMNAILMVAAPLVLVLTVSAGVHLVNYFLDEARQRGTRDAVRRALRVGWWPCTLAAGTTAIGLGSLLVSEIIPVHQFGGLAAASVLGTLVLLLSVVPGAMQWQARQSPARSRATPSLADRLSLDELWAPLVRTILRYRSIIAAGGLAILVLSTWGLFRVQTSVSIRNLLVSESRLVRDYRWFERHLGPLVPIEVVVHLPPECPLDLLERVELITQLGRSLAEIEILDGVTSAATFVPPIPPPGGIVRTARRGAIRSQLQSRESGLLATRFVRNSERGQAWRISARVEAFGDVDYGLFLDQLRGQVDQILDQPRYAGIAATYTGMTPVVYQAQRALLNDLFTSFLTALVLVGLVMVWLLRSLPAGLVAMIPNVFPAVVLFGGMGLGGMKVDIGTVMTASVALGIGVDDTIHFLTWFRRGLRQGQSRSAAILFAFRHCAAAMVQTSMICGLGLLVFALGGFLPTRRFAWMMFALLMVALLGVFFLLPALLAGPLGKPFIPARSRRGVT
jgi:predicted RND superfamily exporter protein